MYFILKVLGVNKKKKKWYSVKLIRIKHFVIWRASFLIVPFLTVYLIIRNDIISKFVSKKKNILFWEFSLVIRLYRVFKTLFNLQSYWSIILFKPYILLYKLISGNYVTKIKIY